MSTKGLSYAVKPGGLTPADHEAIFEMAERRLTCGQISRRLQKHPCTVRWFMYRNGLASPRTVSAVEGESKRKDGHRFYGREEDAFILALRVQNFGLKDIADLASKRFGHRRTAHGIHVRLVMLAAREAAFDGRVAA